MGITAKPIGKVKSVFQKWENVKIKEEQEAKKKNKGKKKKKDLK